MSKQRSWHKSYAPETPTEIEIREITLPEVLDEQAKAYPKHPALLFMGKTMCYAELNRWVNRFALALERLGIGEGDRVAIQLPNLPNTVIANYAVQRLGAVSVMCNPLYTERELSHLLRDSGARLIITLDMLQPRVKAIRENTSLEMVIACHINDYLAFPKKQLYPLLKRQMYRRIDQGVLAFLDLIAGESDQTVANRACWENLAALIYTGGTTGVSKGVMLAHKQLSSNTQQFRSMFYDLEDGVSSILGIFPFFHVAGYSSIQNLCIWCAWADVLVPRPEPKMIIALLKKYRPQFLPGVPTIFQGLLANEAFRQMDLSYIKGFFTGAAPLPEDTGKDLKQLTGADILEVYGMTESSANATVSPWGGRVKTGKAGVPIPNTDLKIVDLDHGQTELSTGQSGEILIKGPQVMMGYYKREEETQKTLRDGWLYSGDIGFLDEDGFLEINDRKNDMIIASGYNIYPREIDEILFEHPKVAEACALGIQDTYRGETVVAFIVCKPGEQLTAEELDAHCRKNLAAYKVPKKYTFLDALPKSAIGKVLRRELRKYD